MAKRSNVLFFLMLTHLSCDTDLADSPPPGFLKLSMTTDAGELNILLKDTLLVNLASARLWRGAERREWAVISDTNRVYNLFAWRRPNAVQVSNKELMYLPPGDYTRLTVRVLLQDTLLVLGGRRYSVHIPQEDYQIVNIDDDLRILAGQILAPQLVFDAEQSLKVQLGRYLLIPTFRLERE